MKYNYLIYISLFFFYACSTSQIDPIDCSIEGPKATAIATTSDCDTATGTITVSVTEGTAPYTYSINSSQIADNETGSFEGLTAGNYTVTVIDSNDCSTTTQVTVLSESGPSITEVEALDAGCGSSIGTITISAAGGSGDLSYSLNGGAPQANHVFTGLSAGSYDLSVTDGAGCETTQQVDVLSGVSLASEISPIIQNNCAVAGCHNGSQAPNLSAASGIIGSASSILSRTSAGTMPPSGKLPDNQIALIECWVNDGAPGN